MNTNKFKGGKIGKPMFNPIRKEIEKVLIETEPVKLNPVQELILKIESQKLKAIEPLLITQNKLIYDKKFK